MSLTSSEKSEERGTSQSDSVRSPAPVPRLEPLPEGVKWVADDCETEVNDSLLKRGLADADEEDEGEGELIVGGVVSRSNSSFSAYFQRSRADDERDNQADLRAVKRAFSMGRLASVLERYRRIDQNCSKPDAAEENLITLRRSSKNRAGNFFETCRRLLGFSS